MDRSCPASKAIWTSQKDLASRLGLTSLGKHIMNKTIKIARANTLMLLNHPPQALFSSCSRITKVNIIFDFINNISVFKINLNY